MPIRTIVAIVIALATATLSPDGHGKGRPTPRVIDSPAWPGATKRIVVTWTLRGRHIRTGEHGEEIPVVTVDLALSVGKTRRRFSTIAELNTVCSIGSQRKCQGPTMPRDRVAELTLEGGGFQLFALVRHRDELHLVREILTDGSCAPDPCPVRRTLLARIPIPPSARFEEHFRLEGQREEEACP